MPRYSSGTPEGRPLADHRDVATHRDLQPAPWHRPLTADTTGLADLRSVSNGVHIHGQRRRPSVQLSAAAQVAARREHVPVPVMSSPARSASALTRETA